MTISPSELRRCLWCAALLPPSTGPGRPRTYCRRSHRQRHYEARRLAAAQGLSADDVLIGRELFDAWRDGIYQLEAAIEDAEQDLGEAPALREYTEAFQGLLLAARRTAAFRLEPKAIGSD